MGELRAPHLQQRPDIITRNASLEVAHFPLCDGLSIRRLPSPAVASRRGSATAGRPRLQPEGEGRLQPPAVPRQRTGSPSYERGSAT